MPLQAKKKPPEENGLCHVKHVWRHFKTVVLNRFYTTPPSK